MAISEQLQQRIDGLIGARDAPAVQNLPYDPSSPSDTRNLPYDPRNEQHAIPMPYSPSEQLTPEDKQRLLMEIEAEQGALTPEEKIQAIGSFEAMAQQAGAPLAEQAMEIQHMGTGSDTVLAHLEPGDVIIPPALLEDDPEFESYLERKFDQYDIMPESRVMQGIGALDSGVKLNPHTGLPEFGFFKKIAKFAKKIVRPVAKIAQYIPGPWQAVAAMADKALTVYDVAKGDISPLALLSVAGPLRTGPSFGESFDAFKAGDGFRGAWANTGIAGQGGIADLFNKGAITPSAFGGDSFMSNVKGVFQSANPADYVQDPTTGEYINKVTGKVGLPFGAKDPSELLSRSGSGIQRLTGGLQGNLFGAEGMAGGLQPVTNASGQITGYADQAGNVYGADVVKQAGYSIDPNTGNIIQQIAGGAGVGGGGAAGAGGIGSLVGGAGSLLGGGGIGDAFKMAGTLGLAGALGKLAYEDTKNMKGVPITPMTAMGPTGRFNIEAEIARRMGQEAPNPVEFGLLPQGTIPELSGGKPIMNAAYGGEVRGVPMSILRPTAVPSMMPLPQAPINMEGFEFGIPENYLAAKNAMVEPLEAAANARRLELSKRSTPRDIIMTDRLHPPQPGDDRGFIPMPLDYGMNNTPTPRQFIGEGAPPSIGRPLPLPIERPPMQYIGEGAPPTGKSLPELLRNINMPFSGLMGDRMPIKGQETLGGLSSITEKIRRRGRGMRGMKKRSMGGEIRNYNMGGALRPMAYADGGDVAMQDFQQMNGQINGIGTETSDEIPAMLSDGEFVMTGRGVRGAGSYVMEKNQGGIISLVPSLGEDRERGTQLMYGLMDEFGSRANG